MPEITALEPVSLREAWPDEARHFTPWLADNIDLLGAKLDLRLDRVQAEVTLPRAGRVDICAQQAGTDARVVIENQLEGSDDSHCLRLLGYAADTDASILVWVAAGFTSYHKRILKWLNEADTIDVYAVTVVAYRVGDRLAVDFHPVVEPTQPPPGRSRPATKNANTLYAEFYRPLVAWLRRRGMQPVGKGGWRGRFRSFQTGHPGAIYGTSLYGNKLRVGLYLHGPGHRQRYGALASCRKPIADKVKGTVLWHERDHGIVLMRPEGISLTEGSEEDMEVARHWMADNLLSLRDAVLPHLDDVMGTTDADPDEARSAD